MTLSPAGDSGTAGADRGRRVLVAGVGNILRGDDGFGPAVIRALECALERDRNYGESVRLVETGTGGINLVLELLDGYDALVIVDAVDRDKPPGSLYILEPEVPKILSLSAWERHDVATDTHQVVPGQVLIIARAAGALPRIIRIVGCQPAETEELSLALSPVVRETVPQAVDAVLALLEEWQTAGDGK